MIITSVAQAARNAFMSSLGCGTSGRSRALLTVLVGAAFLWLAAEAPAQTPGIVIGGFTKADAVCTSTATDGLLVSRESSGGNISCNAGIGNVSTGELTATKQIGPDTGTVSMNVTGLGNLDATGTITGGTLKSTGATDVGTNLTVGGNLDMTGGDISNVGTLGANIVNATTVNAGTLAVTNNATIGGTLDVTGLTSTNGITNTGDITNSGNIQTATLNTTGNASVGGDLTVTGASNLNGGANIGNHLTVAPATVVSMGNNRVQDVAAPIAANDAANKAYVDTGLASAFKEIDKNTQGIAIAMAMGGMALPDSKNFALSANMGFFDSKQALAVQGAMRLTPFVTVNGGVGVGLEDSSTLGGRVGVQVAW